MRPLPAQQHGPFDAKCSSNPIASFDRAHIALIGCITLTLMALVAIVQTDIKKCLAYSTLSQLGYMTVALGASAYSAAIFHLMTHAFFKALLFLAAGAVIIAMHHEQDIRRMGGLKKYLPITYWVSLIGSLALIGFPGSSGYFSKDAIIEAVHHSQIGGAGYAYVLLTAGVFVTALYSFRMYFLVFHGAGPRHFEPHHEAHDEHGGAEAQEHHQVHDEPTPHESRWVVTLPLVLLAIPSVLIGWFAVGPLLILGHAILELALLAALLLPLLVLLAHHFHLWTLSLQRLHSLFVILLYWFLLG